MFEVGSGGEFGDAPPWELAGKPAAKLFAKDFTAGLTEGDCGLRASLVNEGDGGRLASELLDGEQKTGGGVGLGGDDAAGERAGLVPGLQKKAVGTVSEGMGVGSEGQRRVTGFQEGWLAAGGEKALDLFAQHRGGCGRSRLFGGGHQYQYRIQ